MEDNNNILEGPDTPQESSGEEGRVTYTKQQSFLYTAICVVLFFAIYFAVKGIGGVINRPYMMFVYGDELAEEMIAETFDISGISSGSGYKFENARLEKDSSGYAVSMLFSSDELYESEEESGYYSHAEEVLGFDFGNPAADERIEFYPYAENPYFAEYAYGEKYTDTLTAENEVYFFEWEGRQYAFYSLHDTEISSEIRGLFANSEKVF